MPAWRSSSASAQRPPRGWVPQTAEPAPRASEPAGRVAAQDPVAFYEAALEAMQADLGTARAAGDHKAVAALWKQRVALLGVIIDRAEVEGRKDRVRGMSDQELTEEIHRILLEEPAVELIPLFEKMAVKFGYGWPIRCTGCGRVHEGQVANGVDEER